MLSLILNALFSGLVTFVQVLQIGVVSFKDINGIIIWSKWERLLTLHFQKILGNISTKVKRSRFNKSDTVMALSSPGMLRQLRWKVLVYSSISKKTFQMERIFENIVKPHCWNETSNCCYFFIYSKLCVLENLW